MTLWLLISKQFIATNKPKKKKKKKKKHDSLNLQDATGTVVGGSS